LAKTLTQVRAAVRSRADLVNSQFVTDAELDVFINDAKSELHDLLVDTYEDYATDETPTSFTLTSGQSTYTLPSTFYKLRGVDQQVGSKWSEMKKWLFEERNAADVSRRKRYRLVGSVIKILPEDSADGTYRFWKIKRYTPLVNGTDLLDDVLDFDEYVIVRAAISCLEKEESDTSAQQLRLQKLEERIKNMAPKRDAGEADAIADVRYTRNFDEDLL
jgi:hypothetical protein